MTSEKLTVSDPLHPIWIFVTLTIPQSVIMFIYFRIYTLVQSILKSSEKNGWFIFFGVLGFLMLLFSGYALFCLVTKRKVHGIAAAAILVCFTLFIALYISNYDVLFPWGRIPRWMVNQFDSYLYLTTFLLPCLVYALFVSVRKLKILKLERAWQNILMAIVLPIVWAFLFGSLLTPFSGLLGEEYFVLFLSIAIVSTFLLFLFFVIRSIYIIGKVRGEFFRRYRALLLVLFCGVIPLVCLLLNNGHFPGKEHSWGEHSPFGNFSSPLFYLAILVNAFFLCIPHDILLKGEEKLIRILRLLLFLVRSLCSSVSFYFFISLLPFFPIAFILILFIGFGILLLTPIAMFVFHLQILKEDFIYLKRYFKARYLIAGQLTAFLVIPLVISLFFLAERANLNKALRYAYEHSYQDNLAVRIDTSSLKKTLETIRDNKAGSRGFPYITPLYQQLVLNNLTLSNSKLDYLEKLYTGHARFEDQTKAIRRREKEWDSRQDSDIIITNINSNTEYDHTHKLYRSTIDIQLKEQNNVFNSEYKTYFDVPPGSWIDDYYLYIGNKKIKGLLAEKKSVLWVYRNIKSENRDPGILYFVREGVAALKVFPFISSQTRRTGFSITHLEPVTLTIDGIDILLDGEEKGPDKPLLFAGAGGAYLSRAAKEKLPLVKRTPYIHFIVDCSLRSSMSDREEYLDILKQYLSENPEVKGNAKITFANYRSETLDSLTEKKWQSRLFTFKQEGGFALDRVLKTLLFEHYHRGDDRVPIFFVVSSHLDKALYDDKMSDFAFTYPDSPFYYRLRVDRLETYSISTGEYISTDKSGYTQHKVYAYKHNNETYYLPESPGSAVINSLHARPEALTAAGLEGADKYLSLDSLQRQLILYPEKTDLLWKKIFIKSLEMNTLTSLTSFAVLENDAQREALRRKQEQLLASKKYLDAGEETDDSEAMPEPPLLVLLIICLGAFMVWKKRKVLKNAKSG